MRDGCDVSRFEAGSRSVTRSQRSCPSGERRSKRGGISLENRGVVWNVEEEPTVEVCSGRRLSPIADTRRFGTAFSVRGAIGVGGTAPWARLTSIILFGRFLEIL